MRRIISVLMENEPGSLSRIVGVFSQRGYNHNTLEAAVYGIPVFFGKHDNNHKFREAIDLINEKGAFQFSNSEELISIVGEFQQNQQQLEKAGIACKNWVENSKGATIKIMNYLKEINKV